MSDDSLAAQGRAFMQQYTETFDTRRGPLIAELYHVPCVTMRADGSTHCFTSRAEIAQFFDSVAASYAAEGAQSGRFKDFSVIPMGGRSMLTTVDWEMVGAAGRVIRQWRQSYNLIRTAIGWQIFVSTIHTPES